MASVTVVLHVILSHLHSTHKSLHLLKAHRDTVASSSAPPPLPPVCCDVVCLPLVVAVSSEDRLWGLYTHYYTAIRHLRLFNSRDPGVSLQLCVVYPTRSSLSHSICYSPPLPVENILWFQVTCSYC